MLGGHPDYRVLRRLHVPETAAPGPGDNLVIGCAVDVETTGIDPATDRVIELAMRRFAIDEDGRVARVGRPWSWLEDPGFELSPEISRLTGLTRADLSGRSISDAEATCILLDVDFVTAHNARFDRRFVEKRLPLARNRRWACSLNDVDWRSLGFEGRSLPHLLNQAGWFYDAHRAGSDVDALLRLLDHRVGDGDTIASAMIRTAAEPTYELVAAGAPFESRGLLKARGWSWAPARRVWRREVASDRLDGEIEWAVANAYDGRGRPTYREVDWTERYSSD